MSLGLHIHHWLYEGSERDGQFVPVITSKAIQCILLPLWSTKVHHLTLCTSMSTCTWRRLRLYSLAFATTLCSGEDPANNDQMRIHLMKCLENGFAEPFSATNHSAKRPRGYSDCGHVQAAWRERSIHRVVSSALWMYCMSPNSLERMSKVEVLYISCYFFMSCCWRSCKFLSCAVVSLVNFKSLLSSLLGMLFYV